MTAHKHRVEVANRLYRHLKEAWGNRKHQDSALKRSAAQEILHLGAEEVERRLDKLEKKKR